MTKRQIMELLRPYADDAHVCIMQPEQFAESGKYEVMDCYLDITGVVNIQAGQAACSKAERDPQDTLRKRRAEIRAAEKAAQTMQEGGEEG